MVRRWGSRLKTPLGSRVTYQLKKKKMLSYSHVFWIEHNNPPSFYHPIGWRYNYDGADKSNKGCLHQKNNSHVCPTQV